MGPEALRAINSEAVPPTFVGVLRELAPPHRLPHGQTQEGDETLQLLGPRLLGSGLTRGGCAAIRSGSLYLMDFEFDAAKSPANLKKHGIDSIGA